MLSFDFFSVKIWKASQNSPNIVQEAEWDSWTTLWILNWWNIRPTLQYIINTFKKVKTGKN